MRALVCTLLVAGAALAAPAGAQQSLSPGLLTPRLSPRSHAPRGVGAAFWLDGDTCVIPRVERSANATVAAANPDEAIVRLRPGASIAAFVGRHGLIVRRALSLPGAFTVRADT